MLAGASGVSVVDGYRSAGTRKFGAPYPRHYLNDYAWTKMLAEVAVREARPDAVILRPHAVYGPGENKLLPRLLEARWFGRQISLGDGRNRISVTHVDNLVHAIECAVDGSVSGSFNVADAVEPTDDELLRQVLATAGLPARIIYIPTAVAWPLSTAVEAFARVFGQRRPPRLTRYVVAQFTQEYTLDMNAAVQQLGYRPTRTYLDGVGETLAAEPLPRFTNHHRAIGHQPIQK